MSLIVFLLLLIVEGLLVGAFARLALPGPDPMSIPQTIMLGIGGSLIAGIIVAIVTGGTYGAGFLVSLVVSVVILYVIRRRRGGDLTHPGR